MRGARRPYRPEDDRYDGVGKRGEPKESSNADERRSPHQSTVEFAHALAVALDRRKRGKSHLANGSDDQLVYHVEHTTGDPVVTDSGIVHDRADDEKRYSRRELKHKGAGSEPQA